MKETKDILADKKLKDNPFSVPDKYFDSLEESIGGRIAPDNSGSGVPAVLKPAFYLFSMFAVIFGMCYGVLKLTETSEYPDAGNEQLYISDMETFVFNRSTIDFLDAEAEAESQDYIIDTEEIEEYIDSEFSSHQLTSYLLQE